MPRNLPRKKATKRPAWAKKGGKQKVVDADAVNKDRRSYVNDLTRLSMTFDREDAEEERKRGGPTAAADAADDDDVLRWADELGEGKARYESDDDEGGAFDAAYLTPPKAERAPQVGTPARAPGPSSFFSKKDVRLAQNVQVGPYIPVGIQLQKAGAGPASGPARRLSHFRDSDHARAGGHLHQRAGQAPVLAALHRLEAEVEEGAEADRRA